MSQPNRPFGYRDDPAVAAFADDRPISVFDGKCALCSGFVQFVLRRDRKAGFRFVAAQSGLGTALYRHYGLDPVDDETNLLLEDGRVFFKSAGSIRIIEQLGFPWSLIAATRLLPATVRDGLYDIIARHRLRWFGVRETCLMADAAHADRFLG